MVSLEKEGLENERSRVCPDHNSGTRLVRQLTEMMQCGIHRSSSRVLMTLSAILIALAACSGVVPRRTTLAQVDQLLARTVPAGTHYTRVLAVLDSLEVEHSPLQPAENAIYAVWRRTAVGLFDDRSIEASFEFDESRRLIRYKLNEVITAM
jgi:hypothetical protein